MLEAMRWVKPPKVVGICVSGMFRVKGPEGKRRRRRNMVNSSHYCTEKERSKGVEVRGAGGVVTLEVLKPEKHV
jgi:hypothetical protein